MGRAGGAPGTRGRTAGCNERQRWPASGAPRGVPDNKSGGAAASCSQRTAAARAADGEGSRDHVTRAHTHPPPSAPRPAAAATPPPLRAWSPLPCTPPFPPLLLSFNPFPLLSPIFLLPMSPFPSSLFPWLTFPSQAESLLHAPLHLVTPQVIWDGYQEPPGGTEQSGASGPRAGLAWLELVQPLTSKRWTLGQPISFLSASLGDFTQSYSLNRPVF